MYYTDSLILTVLNCDTEVTELGYLRNEKKQIKREARRQNKNMAYRQVKENFWRTEFCVYTDLVNVVVYLQIVANKLQKC